MENTLNNKGKFFAQYWDQKVMTKVVRGENKAKITTHNDVCSNWKFGELVESYLELKPLSSITDEDAKKLGYSSPFLLKKHSSFQVDELRALGYALWWHDLSVEKQIEYGWIKLI